MAIVLEAKIEIEESQSPRLILPLLPGAVAK